TLAARASASWLRPGGSLVCALLFLRETRHTDIHR
ncbi:hypothetical protein, partial [Pseudomonas aeruginosa]